jgi:hypothetical protein
MPYENYMRINGLSSGLQNAPELYTFNANRMNTEETMEDRLWDYIDGLSSPAEKSAVEELIAANLEWQLKYKELLNVHQLMSASELDAPSMRFTRNVMEEIAHYQVAPATRTYINKNIIRGIGAFFLTLITGLLIFSFGQIKWSSPSGSSSVLPSINNFGATVDKFDFQKLFGNIPITLFMLVAVVLGFVLLDMYLQRRKKEQVS